MYVCLYVCKRDRKRKALTHIAVYPLSSLTLLCHFLPSGELSKTGLQPITGLPWRERRGLKIICLSHMTHNDHMKDGRLPSHHQQEWKDQSHHSLWTHSVFWLLITSILLGKQSMTTTKSCLIGINQTIY